MVCGILQEDERDVYLNDDIAVLQSVATRVNSSQLELARVGSGRVESPNPTHRVGLNSEPESKNPQPQPDLTRPEH